MIQEILDDAALLLGEDMPEPLIHPIDGGSAAVYSARCPGKENANEDGAALIPLGPDGAVLAVADGLGGTRAGAQASSVALQALHSSLLEAEGNGSSNGDDPAMRTAILNGFEKANQAVLEMGLGAATTLAVVEIQGNNIRPYHVGDSEIFVFGQRGKIKLQTVSHSPVGFAKEAGMLDEKEAMHHEDRHVVSNVIGAADMRIEIGSVLKLAPMDTLVLTSDGLVDNLHLNEIVERLRKGPLYAAVKNLVAAAHQRMMQPGEGEPSKPDDLTFIVFRGPGRGRKVKNA